MNAFDRPDLSMFDATELEAMLVQALQTTEQAKKNVLFTQGQELKTILQDVTIAFDNYKAIRDALEKNEEREQKSLEEINQYELEESKATN